MRKIAARRRDPRARPLGACKKTGDNEYQVQKPVIGTTTRHGAHAGGGCRNATRTRSTTPMVGAKKDTTKIVTPVVGTKKTEVKTPR